MIKKTTNAKSSAKKSSGPTSRKQELKDLDARTRKGTNGVRGGLGGIGALVAVATVKADEANQDAMKRR